MTCSSTSRPCGGSNSPLFVPRLLPLVVLHWGALLHGWVVGHGIGALLVQVGQDEVSHPGVELPHAGGHHCDGKGSLMVRSHLLLALFLQTDRHIDRQADRQMHTCEYCWACMLAEGLEGKTNLRWNKTGENSTLCQILKGYWCDTVGFFPFKWTRVFILISCTNG